MIITTKKNLLDKVTFKQGAELIIGKIIDIRTFIDLSNEPKVGYKIVYNDEQSKQITVNRTEDELL